jgi:hypothetical protein
MIAGQEQSVTAHGSREMPIWGPVFHKVEMDQDWLPNSVRNASSLTPAGFVTTMARVSALKPLKPRGWSKENAVM